MEHRRIASFGVYTLLLAATPALAAPTGEQAVNYSLMSCSPINRRRSSSG